MRCTGDDGKGEVTTGVNSCSSGRCQNYKQTDKNGRSEYVSINKKDVESFEKEMTSEMARGAYSNSTGSGSGLGVQSSSNYRSGASSGAASEAGGQNTNTSIVLDAENPFNGRTICAGNKSCQAHQDEIQTQQLVVMTSLIPIGGAELGGLKLFNWLKKGDDIRDINRYTDIATDVSKTDARALLRNGDTGLTEEQITSSLKQLGKGRVDSVSMKVVNNSLDLKLYLERGGAVSGYQRMSFLISPEGVTKRAVQTAFDDAGALVRQLPGAAKNNLYDVKK